MKELGLFSLKKAWRRPYYHVLVFKLLWQKTEPPFFQGFTWERLEVMSKSYSWGDSGWIQQENFSQ